ncbi:hypothetical protein LBMAG42_37070 [Deltaproteobacteria bacterium]|nr:hypothetical protein LBMAG42_37070 [Deltaproteobacteria bacterium]
MDCHGGADFADIRSAIAGAISGDEIAVAPCAYYGSLDFEGKSLAIVGTDPATTIVYASPGTSVLKATKGEGRATRVEAITLTGGGGDAETPGIEVSFSSLVLRNVVVSGNAGMAALYSRSGHVLIERTVFENNTASLGILIQARRGEVVVQDSTVRCGTVGVGYQAEHGAALVDGATFECANGRSIEIFHAQSRIQRSVLAGQLYVENEGNDDEYTVVKGTVLASGASVLYSGLVLENVVATGGLIASGSSLSLSSSIVTGQDCAITASGSTVTTSYSVFWENAANGCGFADPLTRDSTSKAVDPGFIDAAGSDFHLAAESSLVNAGPTTSSSNDPDGSRNDIGAYGGHFSLGGGW